MRRNIPFLLLLVLLAGSGYTMGVSYRESKALTPVGLYDQCTGSMTSAPNNIVLSCADGNTGFAKLKWYAWGDYTAYATGLYVQNLCKPTCVAGKWAEIPVTLYAWAPKNGVYSQVGVHQR
jgi:hypothetical protein